MVPTSLIEKLKTLYNIISSNPFFFVALIIALLLLVLITILLKKNKQINIKLFIIVWTIIASAILIKYHKLILNFGDSLFENILMSIYFPNLAIFTIVLIISNISLFWNLVRKEVHTTYKIIQIPSAILINFLFVLILDIVVSNNIDIYSQTEVYQNNDLFVLLETCMLIFTINVILTIMVFMIKKLLKQNNKNNDNKIQEEQIKPINNMQYITTLPTSIPTTQLNSNVESFESIIPPIQNNINNINSSVQYPNVLQSNQNNLVQPFNNQPPVNLIPPVVNNPNNLNQNQTISKQNETQEEEIEILKLV